MDELVKGIVDFFSDNPAFFTLVIGFVIGFIVGIRKG